MSKKPRHASMAEQLNPLLAYRNRPEGPIEPIKTNWRAEVANDNNHEDLDGLHTERRAAIRPTLREIMNEVAEGEVARNEAGQIVGIGKLRFSDGNQTERAHRYSIDGKVIEFDAPMPVGAMLGTHDRQERVLGGDTIVSNTGYTTVYGGKRPNAVKRKTKTARQAEKPAPKKTKAELRAEIEALGAFPVTVCKKGFPWKPSSLRELFAGLEKGKKGESGSIAWEDITTHVVERELWAEIIASLPKSDRQTLDVAATAGSMADIGKAHGKHGKHAERQGRAMLIAANDNVVAAVTKLAA